MTLTTRSGHLGWGARCFRDPAKARSGARRRSLGYCRAHVDEGFMFSMRRCLEKRHDALMLNLNRSYWEVVGVGS